MVFAPSWGRTFTNNAIYYKHAIPLELRTSNLLLVSSTPEGSYIYRNEWEHKEFDPSRGRTF